MKLEEEEAPGMVPAARGEGVSEQVRQTFEAALERVRPIAEAVIRKLRGLSDPPDQVEVEFGLKMNAQAGVVLTGAGAEAHYRVTLTWKQESKA
ncbi:CU044_2847 family protein [Thermoflexus sp.]|uniref:CU044_2847 family protein n=1 Tax=Thermoflexus sp. TaxID=1969742 RepID=UPI002ADDEC2B|nr:CU044_2847 family protein [Thermoflexus sp.]